MASSTASASWYPNNQDPTSSGPALAPPHHMQQHHHTSHHNLQSSNDTPMEQTPHLDASTPPSQAMVPVHYNGSNINNGPISSNGGSPVGRPPSSASTSSAGSFHTAHTASTVHTAHTAHTSNTSHSMHPQHQHHHYHHQQQQQQHLPGSTTNPSGHHPGMNYHTMHHQAGGFTSGARPGPGAGGHSNPYVHPTPHVPGHGHPQAGLVRPTGRYPMPQRNGFAQQHPVRPVPRMPRQPHFPPQGLHHPSQHHGPQNLGYPHQTPPMMGQHPLYPTPSNHHIGGPAQQQQQSGIPTPPPPSQQPASGPQPLRQLPPGSVGSQDHPNGANHSNVPQGYNYPPKHHIHLHPAGRPQNPPQGPHLHPERSPTLSGMQNGYLPHPHQPMNPTYQHHGLPGGNSMGMQGDMPYDLPYTQHPASGAPVGPYPPVQHNQTNNGGAAPPAQFMLRPEEQHPVPHMQQKPQGGFQHPQYARRPSYEASPETTVDAQAISRSPSPPPAPPSSGFHQDSEQGKVDPDVPEGISTKVERATSVGSLDSLNRVMAQNNIARPAGPSHQHQTNAPGALGERGTNTTNVTGKLPSSSSSSLQATQSRGGPPKNKEDATADAASILLQLSSVVKNEGNAENENPQATLLSPPGGLPQDKKKTNLLQRRSDTNTTTTKMAEGDASVDNSSSARGSPDHHDCAPELTSEPSSDSIETIVDSEFPCPVPDNYPTRLCLPYDNSKLNTLHCFLRSELLEIFVVEKSRNKSPTHSPGSSVGRVGLRCVHCAMVRKHRDDRDEAPMAVFYPKSVAEIYRLVTSWQRCHLRKCRNLPPAVRSRWQMLRDNDKSRGKTHYWVTSAKQLGLVDCNSRAGGVRFAADFDASKLEGCIMSATRTTNSDGELMPTCQATTSDDTVEAEPLATAVATDSTATLVVGSRSEPTAKDEDESDKNIKMEEDTQSDTIVNDEDKTDNNIKMEEDTQSEAIVKEEDKKDNNIKMEEDTQSETIVKEEVETDTHIKIDEGGTSVSETLSSS